jgi:hypothetical protein
MVVRPLDEGTGIMRFRAAFGVLFAGALLVGACGGDSSSSDTGASGTTTTAPSDGGGNDTTTTSGGTTGTVSTGDLAGLFGGDCAAAASLVTSAYASLFTGNSGMDFDEASSAFEKFADEAPDAIKADVKLISQAFVNLVTALRENDIDLADPTTYTDPAKMAKLSAISEETDALNTPEYQAASDRVSAYIDSHCEA